MSFSLAGATNDELVDNLVSYNIITSPELAAAMKEIDRGHFVPDEDLSYIDSPAPIGFGATISAPHMHAYALELLKDHLKPGCKVLDVGSGSGYLSSVMARLVTRGGAPGQVIGIDHIPELVESSINNVKKDAKSRELLESGVLRLVVGDGWKGLVNDAPFDAIHVGAAAASVPPALTEQLKAGGRMVIPVGPEGAEQKLAVVDKKKDGSVMRQDVMSVVYVSDLIVINL